MQETSWLCTMSFVPMGLADHGPMSDSVKVTVVAPQGWDTVPHPSKAEGMSPECHKGTRGGTQPPSDTATKAQSQITHTQNLP